MNLRLVRLEFRGTLRRKVGYVALLAAVVVACVAAAFPGMSPSTAYSPATVVGFAVFASGCVCLFTSAYLGACKGAEDHELNMSKEHHIAGRARMAVLWERLIAVTLICLAAPLVALVTAATVAVGQVLTRQVLGHAAAQTVASVRLFGAAFLGSVLSGFMGFSLAYLSRSRFLGLLGWLGLLFTYASVVPTAANSKAAVVVLRYLPCGPVLDMFLGDDNYLDRNLGFSLSSSITSLLGTVVVLTITMLLVARARRLA